MHFRLEKQKQEVDENMAIDEYGDKELRSDAVYSSLFEVKETAFNYHLLRRRMLKTITRNEKVQIEAM